MKIKVVLGMAILALVVGCAKSNDDKKVGTQQGQPQDPPPPAGFEQEFVGFDPKANSLIYTKDSLYHGVTVELLEKPTYREYDYDLCFNVEYKHNRVKAKPVYALEVRVDKAGQNFVTELKVFLVREKTTAKSLKLMDKPVVSSKGGCKNPVVIATFKGVEAALTRGYRLDQPHDLLKSGLRMTAVTKEEIEKLRSTLKKYEELGKGFQTWSMASTSPILDYSTPASLSGEPDDSVKQLMAYILAAETQVTHDFWSLKVYEIAESPLNQKQENQK